MNRLATIGTVLALTVVSAVSQAQMGMEPSRLTLRAGFFWPTANETRTVAGARWFTFGGNYDLGDLGMKTQDPTVKSSFNLSVDYMGKGNYTNVPIMFNYRGQQKQFFWQAGGGVGFVRTPKVGGGAVTNNEFVYNFGLGYEFSYGKAPLFAELRFTGSVEDRLNGYSLMLGYRF
jgi:hypothetical protein